MEERILVTDTFTNTTFETTEAKLNEAEQFVNDFDRVELKEFLAKMEVVSPLTGKYVWDKTFTKKVYGIDNIMFLTEKPPEPSPDGLRMILLSYFPLPDLEEIVDDYLGRH